MKTPETSLLDLKAALNDSTFQLGEKVRIAKENSTVGILERRVTITREQRQQMNGGMERLPFKTVQLTSFLICFEGSCSKF